MKRVRSRGLTFAAATANFQQLVRSTDGLDMLSKAIQYISLLLSWLLMANFALNKSLINLSRNVSMARSWMRLGRLVPEFVTLEEMMSKGIPSNPKRGLDLVRVLSNIVYFICDHLYWLISSGVIPFLSIESYFSPMVS
eukprot:TRINITY_DN2195_c0_g1_i1.p1 TRINITY_DN2195_c0_g1~~TRINITY_DN2195_c0_g1_i1.p1  ORF type:complete len:139 (-),score=14.86 TRINITY_DN2195_c0_g1_i1:514-930(-)